MYADEQIAVNAEYFFQNYFGEGNSILISKTSFSGKNAFIIQLAGEEKTEEEIIKAKQAVKEFLENSGHKIINIFGQHIHPNDVWENSVKHYIEYTFICEN